MKFDESRFGWGQPNPKIRKGAVGYFADRYRVLRELVEQGSTDMLMELVDVSLNRSYPYRCDEGVNTQLFYVIEEAKKGKQNDDKK